MNISDYRYGTVTALTNSSDYPFSPAEAVAFARFGGFVLQRYPDLGNLPDAVCRATLVDLHKHLHQRSSLESNPQSPALWAKFISPEKYAKAMRDDLRVTLKSPEEDLNLCVTSYLGFSKVTTNVDDLTKKWEEAYAPCETTKGCDDACYPVEKSSESSEDPTETIRVSGYGQTVIYKGQTIGSDEPVVIDWDSGMPRVTLTLVADRIIVE